MATDLLASGSTVKSGTLNGVTSSTGSSASSQKAASIAAQNAALIAAKEKGTASGTASASSGSAASQAQLSSDINFFLKLLTTQLKNQDPSAPLDTNQFTQQIAQYSSVQQQVNTNSNLEKLLAANKQSSAVTAVGYIGKEIESKGNTGVVTGGQGAFSYILPKAANSAEITITNSIGQVVFRGNGDTKSGRNIVVWDGKNSTTGKQEPDGTYKIAINALDPAGKAILAETRSVATVTGVETDSAGNTLLSAGNGTINFNDVLAVRAISRANL
jgi:flagellar basal-body rod modification protein FlgD